MTDLADVAKSQHIRPLGCYFSSKNSSREIPNSKTPLLASAEACLENLQDLIQSIDATTESISKPGATTDAERQEVLAAAEEFRATAESTLNAIQYIVIGARRCVYRSCAETLSSSNHNRSTAWWRSEWPIGI